MTSLRLLLCAASLALLPIVGHAEGPPAAPAAPAAPVAPADPPALGDCGGKDGECAWLLDNDVPLFRLQEEVKRLEIARWGETAERDFAPSVREAVRTCGANAIGARRQCLHEDLSLAIAKARLLLPAKQRGRGNVSSGPFALTCDVPGTRRLVRVGDSVVVDLPRGFVVLDPVMLASGERYGAWRPEGEIVIHGKGTDFNVFEPGMAPYSCRLSERELR